jgi:molecular chaperone DnaK (HSP70)
LTAARQAGLSQVTLLEEPQAAFYSWAGPDRRPVAQAPARRRRRPVCDVGGGTTDFSSIEVVRRRHREPGAGTESPVGDHILLGGYNMDLTLAHGAAQRLGDRLAPLQFRSLVHACRRAKEQLLAADAPEQLAVSILGRSSKLIGGTVRLDLLRGAHPAGHPGRLLSFVDRGARPQKLPEHGLRELGLP